VILSGLEIHKRLGRGIIIEPYRPEQLNPNSYNIGLHNTLAVYTEPRLDARERNDIREVEIPESGLWLEPGKLYLGRTAEYTEAHDCVPMLEGRSSVGRLGIAIHVTAGFGDIGFCGYWTLEISCIQPVKIYRDMEVCQIYYHQILGAYEKYNSVKYQNAQGIQPSLLYTELRKVTGG